MGYRPVGKAYGQVARREVEKVRTDPALHAPRATVVDLKQRLILLGSEIVLIKAYIVVDKLDAGENVVACNAVAALGAGICLSFALHRGYPLS